MLTTRNISMFRSLLSSFRGAIAISKMNFSTNKELSALGIDPTVGLTPEQKKLYTTARDFAKNEFALDMHTWDFGEIFPYEGLSNAASLGFGALYCRDEFGGSGLGFLETSLILEAIATACVGTTARISIHNKAAWIIDQYGTAEQRRKWIPDMSTMHKTGTFCHNEVNNATDAIAKAKDSGDHYILSGSKQFVNGHSDVFLILCQIGSSGNLSCVMVENGSPGLSFGKKTMKIGWNSQPIRALILEDCRVPKCNVIGKVGLGLTIAKDVLNITRVSIGSRSLGATQTAIEQTFDHLIGQKKLVEPLSTLPKTNYDLTEMCMNLNRARSMVRNGARALQNKSDDYPKLCESAKSFAADTCLSICHQALQLHCVAV